MMQKVVVLYPDGTQEYKEIDIPDPEPLPDPEPIFNPSAMELQAVMRLSRMQAQAMPDAQAVTVPELYPAWTEGTAYGGEGQTQIVSRPSGRLYRCQSPHTSQTGWEPETARALWTAIAGGEAGTEEDPTPEPTVWDELAAAIMEGVNAV